VAYSSGAINWQSLVLSMNQESKVETSERKLPDYVDPVLHLLSRSLNNGNVSLYHEIREDHIHHGFFSGTIPISLGDGVEGRS